MTPVWIFRAAAIPLAVVCAIHATLSLASSIVEPASLPVPTRSTQRPSDARVATAEWAARIAPFRSDAKVQLALALAGRALAPGANSGDSKVTLAAGQAVKDALYDAPSESRLWLVLAGLQARKAGAANRSVEALKMSYFTGPNSAEIIPARLDAVTQADALNDADLRELARGDVRAVLTRMPEQKSALVADYLRASPAGKSFLLEATDLIDPGYSAVLRGLK